MNALIGHKRQRILYLHFPLKTDVLDFHAGLVFAGTHTQEGNAVPMTRVHIGLNLKDKPGKVRLRRFHATSPGIATERSRRPLNERFQHIFDAEIINSGSEKHRALLGMQEFFQIKGFACTLNQFDGITHLSDFHRIERVKSRIVQSFDQLGLSAQMVLPGGKPHQVILKK